MSKDNGGAAFSMPLSTDERSTECNVAYDQDGMTLRDWFAGQALTGIIRSSIEGTVDDYGPRFVAIDSYRVADTMLAERNKEGTEA